MRRGWDVDAVTFNDDVMSGTLALLKNIAEDKKPFTWVPKPIKRQAGDAVRRGTESFQKTVQWVEFVRVRFGENKVRLKRQEINRNCAKLLEDDSYYFPLK